MALRFPAGQPKRSRSSDRSRRQASSLGTCSMWNVTVRARPWAIRSKWAGWPPWPNGRDIRAIEFPWVPSSPTLGIWKPRRAWLAWPRFCWPCAMTPFPARCTATRRIPILPFRNYLFGFHPRRNPGLRAIAPGLPALIALEPVDPMPI